MKPKAPSPEKQGHLLYQNLLEQLNPKDPLLVLAQSFSRNELMIRLHTKTRKKNQERIRSSLNYYILRLDMELLLS